MQFSHSRSPIAGCIYPFGCTCCASLPPTKRWYTRRWWSVARLKNADGANVPLATEGHSCIGAHRRCDDVPLRSFSTFVSSRSGRRIVRLGRLWLGFQSQQLLPSPLDVIFQTRDRA